MIDKIKIGSTIYEIKDTSIADEVRNITSQDIENWNNVVNRKNEETVTEELKTASGAELVLTDCIAKSPEKLVMTGKTITKSDISTTPEESFSLLVNDKTYSLPYIAGLVNNNDSVTYADEIDVVSKIATRRIRKIVFTGDEEITFSNYYSFVYTISDEKHYHNSASNYDTKCGALCSHFTIWNYGSLTPTGTYANGYFGLNKDGDKVNFAYRPDSEVTPTIDEFKTYLKEQYEAGTPVIVYYILKTEYSEIVEIDDVVLNEGNNTISNSEENNMELSYYVKGTTSSTNNSTDFVDKIGVVDSSSEYWNDFKHFMGRNPETSNITEQMESPLESMGMITAHADRWKTGQEGMSTSGVLSESSFVQGGHVFEGWDTEEMWRITMLIGKFATGRAHIFTFKPNESGVEEFGIVTVGSDHEYEGADFARKYMQMWGTVIASKGFCGANNYGSQKYYGGIASSDKSVPSGANMEVTANANSIPNRIQFNDCTNGFKIPVLEADPEIIEDGVFWFNSTESGFKGVIGGEVKKFTMTNE